MSIVFNAGTYVLSAADVETLGNALAFLAAYEHSSEFSLAHRKLAGRLNLMPEQFSLLVDAALLLRRQRDLIVQREGKNYITAAWNSLDLAERLHEHVGLTPMDQLPQIAGGAAGPTHKCAISTCDVRISKTRLMCPEHWALVPTNVQGRVAEALQVDRATAPIVERDFAATAIDSAVRYVERLLARRETD